MPESLQKRELGPHKGGRAILTSFSDPDFVQHDKPGASPRQNAANSVECRSLPLYAAIAKTFYERRGLAYCRPWQPYYLAFRRRFN